jgi:hypothetical protein
MERKWEWIKNRLLELNYPDIAKLANEIDQTLIRLYKYKTTKKWREDYEYINKKYNSLTNIVQKLKYINFSLVISTGYCTACKYHKIECDICNFANECKPCYISGSMVVKVTDLLKKAM